MKKATHSPKSRATANLPAAPTDHAAVANQYARKVVSGDIAACDWVVRACQRHLDDLERSKSKDFPYEFIPSKAARICKFIEALPHTKDDFKNRAANKETLHLEPWQKFIVCSLFGWVDKQTGCYRFSEAYIEVPRKNGKSVLLATIGLYKFAADGEFGAEVYSGATTEKQAWEIFRPAKLMVERTPTLRRAFGITVNAKSLTILKNGSRFEPVIGKPGDGASPSCALIDEYHEHVSDELVETMRTGMGARKNPLLIQITTAGSDRSGPCYSRRDDVQKLLRRTQENERLFGIIYTLDDGDDWKSLESSKKANPNYGVSINPDVLTQDHLAALQSARLQNSYRTKRQNIWVNAAIGWMNMAAWDACADPNLKLEDFKKQDCWIGLDLASKLDLAAKVRIFKRIISGKTHYYAFGTYYLNEKAVEQSAGGHYKQWANEDLLVVTEGEVTDFNRIVDDLEEDCQLFNVLQLPHDPSNAQPLLQMATARPKWNQAVVPVDITPSKANFTPAMREIEGAVADGTFHHNGDKILAWALGNVIVKPDSRDYLYPTKLRNENKIDPAVAMMMGVMQARTESQPSVYETRGLLSV